MKPIYKTIAIILAVGMLYTGCSESVSNGKEIDTSTPEEVDEQIVQPSETEAEPELSYLGTLKVENFKGGNIHDHCSGSGGLS